MHERSEFCHNCGIRLSGPYCAACGQKAVPLTVTLHDFVHELTHETLHVDGRVFRTIRRLLLSPGFLTREYVQGRRARWISPIRLYLIFSVVFFALSALTPLRVVEPQQGGNGLTFSNRAPISISADDAEDALLYAQKLGYRSVEELEQAVNNALKSWLPRIMFLVVPLFAWFVAVAYRRVDRNYLHHLIFALHVHAAWFALGALGAGLELISQPVGDIVQVFALVYVLVYVILAFRRVYGRVRFGFARIAAVFLAYAALLIAGVVAIVLPFVIFDRIN